MRFLLPLLLLPAVLHSANICFENFGKTLCGDYKTADGVIVKTALDKKRLQARYKEKITQLAFLHDANLFLIHTPTPMALLKTLNEAPDIAYAQPDIIQRRTHAASQKPFPATMKTFREQQGYGLGEKIVIAVIDDGFNLKHEDLQGVQLGFSYDADAKNLDPSAKTAMDNHGTRVAGIIFAQHNGIGIDGIAPNATFVPIRQTTTKTSDTVLAFTVASLSHADIINCSWNSPQLLQPVYDVITDTARYGRGGKGTAVVFAAGNESKRLEPNAIEAAIAEAVTVATNQSYSNYGEMVDFRLNGRIRTTLPTGYGFFGGTSAAAPVVSGLLALEMERHPEYNTSRIINTLQHALKKALKTPNANRPFWEREKRE